MAVFVGVAPPPTLSATQGQGYFLPGKSNELGLPQLTARKSKPRMLLPQSPANEPESLSLLRLTPMPRNKSKSLKGKKRAKKIDDEDLDSEFFINDSEENIEEVVAVSSTRL